jgi:hypothetical protein
VIGLTYQFRDDLHIEIRLFKQPKVHVFKVYYVTQNELALTTQQGIMYLEPETYHRVMPPLKK